MLDLKHLWKVQRAVVVFLYPETMGDSDMPAPEVG